MAAANLLDLSDHEFWLAWRALSQEEKNSLPPDVRAKCYERFKKISPADSARSEKQVERAANAAAAEPIDGAALLDEVLEFLERFVKYPSVNEAIAHCLWCAHCHAMDVWDSTPRIAFLSPEPGSGKSRALEISETLVPNPVEAINATPAYLFRKVSDPAGMPTLLFDEVDTVFGPKAKDHEEIRGILNAGHRRGAVAGRCVVRGKTIETEELPAYCAVALAGIGNLPDTILSRAVVVRMRRRTPTESVDPYRRRLHSAIGNALRDRLAAWASQRQAELSIIPTMPDGVSDRHADVWESLLAVANAAGGAWPTAANVAAVTLVTASKVATPSLGIRLLADLREVFGDQDNILTRDILKALVALDEAPWGDLRGKPISDLVLANYLRPYGVRSRSVRVGTATGKGYSRMDLVDPWNRYLPLPVTGTQDSNINS